MTTTAPLHEKPVGVSSIELFFDLVFVFVITQITQLVEHAHGAMDFLRALLVLVPIWWMYAGYAWLTNNAIQNLIEMGRRHAPAQESADGFSAKLNSPLVSHSSRPFR